MVWPCSLLAGISAISAFLVRPFPNVLPQSKVCEVTGVIYERETFTNGERYELNLLTVKDKIEIKCRNIKIYLFASPSVVLQPGDIIKYETQFEKLGNASPGGPQYLTYDKIRVYDGKKSKNGKERFHYRNGNLKIIGEEKGWQSMSWRWREQLTVSLDKSGLSKDCTPLLRALLTGRRNGMNPERLESFRDAGVAHALAVSGMHVGIIAGMIIWLSLPMNLFGGRKWRFLAAALGAWGFALLTGLQFSTVRSTLMLTLVALGMISERRVNPFASLCMAACIILIISPTALWDVGFQLSFCCVAGITLFVEPLNPVDKRSHNITHGVIAGLLTTVVATGVTWVITSYYFGSVPLHFMTSNLLLLPVLPVIMIGGMVQALLTEFGIEIESLRWLLDNMTDKIFSIIDRFSSGAVTVNPPKHTVWFWLCGVGSMAIALHKPRKEARMLAGARPASIVRTKYVRFGIDLRFFITGILLFLLSFISLMGYMDHQRMVKIFHFGYLFLEFFNLDIRDSAIGKI